MIIGLSNPRARYYFRAICWEKTLLIGVSFKKGIWEVNDYMENPSGALMLTILKKNLLEGKAALYFRDELKDLALNYPSK